MHRPRPGRTLCDIAARTGVTERTAYGIITDLTEAGCVVKLRDGRLNRYQIQAHLLLPETGSRDGALARLRRPDAIAEGANRVRPADAAGPGDG